MRYLFFFFVYLLTIEVSAHEYESIIISENKKNLSKEIYSTLKRDHFQARVDTTNFNERYILAIDAFLRPILWIFSIYFRLFKFNSSEDAAPPETNSMPDSVFIIKKIGKQPI